MTPEEMNKNIITSILIVGLSSAWGQDLSPKYIELAQKIHKDMNHEYVICMKVAENRENLALKKSYNAIDITKMPSKINHLNTKTVLGYPVSAGEVFDMDAIVISTKKEDQEECKKLIPTVEEMANEIERQSLLMKIAKYAN